MINTFPLSDRNSTDLAQLSTLYRPAITLGSPSSFTSEESPTLRVAAQSPIKPPPHGCAKLAPLLLPIRRHMPNREISLPSWCILRKLLEVALAIVISNIAGATQKVEDRLVQVLDYRAGLEHSGVEDADCRDEWVLGDVVSRASQ